MDTKYNYNNVNTNKNGVKEMYHKKDNHIKRAELHLHTKLSDDISVISLEEIFDKAEELGLSAVAFTNLNNVQDFPKIANYYNKKNPNFNIVYGVEVRYTNEEGVAPLGATLLAINQEGIKELYKIISSIQNDGVTDLIDLEVLRQNRYNLIVGSCGNMGELYTSLVFERSQEEIDKIAAFYDYFEIYPTDDENEKLIYKKIYKLGEELGVPVVATGNCHYLTQEDEICRRIVNTVKKRKDNNKKRWVHTTEQMLEEFAYLGEKGAYNVVVDNPEFIVDLIEPITPIREGFFGVELENDYQQVEKFCFDKAKEIYGEDLPVLVNERLKAELDLIQKNGFASQYLIACKMAKNITDNGHLIDARGSAGSVLSTFLLGVSDVNSLPPHYYCPECHYFEENNLAKDGFDLPKKFCPHCLTELKKEGHNIPFETFMGYEGHKMPDFDINVASGMRLFEIKYMQKLFGKSKIAMGGTISTLWEQSAQKMVEIFEDKTDINFSAKRKEQIISKLTDIKVDEGMHPAGVMVIPKDIEFEDFTPINENWAPIPKTHLEFHDLYDTILKLDVLEVYVIDFLEALQKSTGVALDRIDINDPEVYRYFQKADTLCIPEFNTAFMHDLLIKTNPETFSDLVKTIGLAHGTNVWTDNGELLLERGISVSALPSLRDDCMNDLITIGVDRKTAYRFSDAVRKGMFAKDRVNVEDVNLYKNITKPLGDWYFDYCSKIRYMFPKAHAVEYVINALRCAWYKNYYPTEFYKAYISCYFDKNKELTGETFEEYEAIKKECMRSGIII